MPSFKYFIFYIFLTFILTALFVIFTLNYFKIKILIETLENIESDNPLITMNPKSKPGYKGVSLTILQSTVPSGIQS